MYYLKVKRVIGLALLLTMAGLTSIHITKADDNFSAPNLPPSICDKVQVEAGNEVAFHAYAIGVQVYKWNGTSWAFVAPIAILYGDAGYNGQVGIHYAGPTWESNSGSKVVAARVEGCTPDLTAIPWLKLKAVSTSGPGIFSSATYVQRVNTTGGLAPTTPGSTIGEVVQVPYTAEYYFYRAEN